MQLLDVVDGKGRYLTLADGRKILDAAAGAAVACLGHGDERVKEAVVKQMDAISYAHGQVYTSAAIENLAALLVNTTEGKMSHAYFMSSGSL